MLRCLDRVQLLLQQLCLQPEALGSLTGGCCSCCLLLGLALCLLQGCVMLTGLQDNMLVTVSEHSHVDTVWHTAGAPRSLDSSKLVRNPTA
jgi:hypothetical protein